MSLTRRQLAGALALGSAFGLPSLARATQPLYRIEELTAPDRAQVFPEAINAHGMVTGAVASDWPGRNGKAFKGVPGRFKTVPWAGLPSVGLGINDDGVVVGVRTAHGSGDHPGPAWRWGREGPAELSVPGAPVLDHAVDINNAGVMVGTSRARQLWVSDGHEVQLLGLTPGMTNIGAAAINRHAAVCGTRWSTDTAVGARAFVWDGRHEQALDSGTFSDVARDMNDAGQVCGYLQTSQGGARQAFLWTEGQCVLLGPFDTPAIWSCANAVNRHGLVVGDAVVESTWSDRHRRVAFVWRDGVVHDLNKVRDASSVGWTLLTAIDINDRGQVLGVGRRQVGYRSTRCHYVATPIA
ncbi:hypothetical protein [Ideonella sp.]|uniref:hypothetical protein n=1 Tax=Ideonella sp. TaxID=1929293 RepID=UPI0035B4DF2A